TRPRPSVSGAWRIPPASTPGETAQRGRDLRREQLDRRRGPLEAHARVVQAIDAGQLAVAESLDPGPESRQHLLRAAPGSALVDERPVERRQAVGRLGRVGLLPGHIRAELMPDAL